MPARLAQFVSQGEWYYRKAQEQIEAKVATVLVRLCGNNELKTRQMGGGVGESERRVAESEIWCHIWTDVISACGWREGRRQMDRVRLEIPKSLALARSAADAPLADSPSASILALLVLPPVDVALAHRRRRRSL